MASSQPSPVASPPPRVRALGPEDLPAATTVVAAAFGVELTRRSDRARWLERVSHPYDTDPDGCFVALGEDRVVGVAEVILRDGLWILSLLAVDPDWHSAGVGGALMEAALGVGDPRAPGLIVSSNDPRALRLYARSGFRLLPTFEAHGPVRRSALPARAAVVRDDAAPDFEALAALSRAIRGAEHTPDLSFALRRGGRLLTLRDRGFAVAMPGAGIWLLVARDDDAAQALAWRGLELAQDGEGALMRWMLGRQAWAIDVAVRAGLRLTAYGGLAVRGAVSPLHAFLPSAPFG